MRAGIRLSIYLALVFPCASFAQGNGGDLTFSLQFLGLTYHPGQLSVDERQSYPRKLDPKGQFVLQLGAQFDFEWKRKSREIWGLRSSFALFKDCIDVWEGFLHFGPTLHPQYGNGGFGIGLGPTWIFRQNWWGHPKVPWYHGDLFYGYEHVHSKWQKAFLWYGGNLFVDVGRVNEPWNFHYSLIPGWPQVLTSSFGISLNN